MHSYMGQNHGQSLQLIPSVMLQRSLPAFIYISSHWFDTASTGDRDNILVILDQRHTYLASVGTNTLTNMSKLTAQVQTNIKDVCLISILAFTWGGSSRAANISDTAGSFSTLLGLQLSHCCIKSGLDIAPRTHVFGLLLTPHYLGTRILPHNLHQSMSRGLQLGLNGACYVPMLCVMFCVLCITCYVLRVSR